MKPHLLPGDASEEIVALIESLHSTERRLEELTAGEVDTVADGDGRPFLLRAPQDELRHSEAAKQATILNALPARIALIDARGLIISVNEAWRRFGSATAVAGPGFGIGLNYLELCACVEGDHSSEARAVAEGIRSVLDGAEKSFSIEYPCHSPTEQRWFRLTVTPLSDSRRHGAVVMHVNVTQQKQSEDRLRESERRFSDMLGNVQLVSIMLDREARITYCNEYLLELTGWRREELIGRDWCEVFLPPEPGDMRRVFLALLANRPEAWHHENEILTRSGARRLVRWNNSVLRSEAGDVIGTASIGEDITERKLSEIRIKRLNRVYAVLSGINTLIVRARDRDELFRESCRIAAEQGKFEIAWIGLLDPQTQDVTPVAWAGEKAEKVVDVTRSAREDTPAGQGSVGQAIRERRPVLISDLTVLGLGGPRLKEIQELGLRSHITLPLFEGQAVAGTLTLYSREPNYFDEEELGLLTELSGDISFALENIAKQQKLDKLARMRAVSSEINAAILRIHDREALLRESCRVAVEHGKFELVWTAFVDEQKRHIQPVAWSGFSDKVARDYPWARLGPPGVTLAEVIRTRKVAIRNDFDAEMAGSMREEASRQGYRSTACVPFTASDSVVGAIILFAREQGFFDDEEIALLNEVAGNISFALEHIEKEEKIARLSRIQAVTSSINALIVRVHERRELFNEACRIALEEGKFAVAWIGVLDPVTQDVTPVASAGESAAALTSITTSVRDDIPQGRGTVGRAFRERHPVFNNDITAHNAGGPRRDTTLKLGFHSMIALPLFEDQTVVATLALYASEPNFFDGEELRLLTELAGDISFALANISRQQKLDKLSRVRAVSGEINAAIVRIYERSALLKDACRIISEHGKFELIWIAGIDHVGQQIQPVAWTGFSEEAAHAVNWSSISSTRGTIGEAIHSRKPSVRNDVTGELPGGTLRQEAMRRGYRSSLCLPLMVDDKVTALIVLFATGQGFFDKDELALPEAVASDLSFALQAIERQEKLDYLAYYDALTGLANRTLFLERVTQHIRSAVSGGHKLALYLIDLEGFKNINDTLGRPAGDTLLRQVAEWLTRAKGDANLLARVGADHFAVVLPEIKQEEEVARRLEKMLEGFLGHEFHLNDAVFRIAAKVGVALFPDDGADADTLFRNGEAALKKAKASGERYLFYTQKMTETVATKLTLENRLRQALDNEEFVLHYQPKVNLSSGKVTGAEALIRWNDSRTGLVPPGQFIPILEETGLIYAVGRWALEKAVEDHLRWRRAGLAAVRVAVNVSPLQLRSCLFADEVTQALSIDPYSAAGLELEITESLIMEDVKHSIESLQALRALGISIAIDDFGTGFSSLSYLSKLPVDTLKIDRSFIIDMTTGPEGLALVSTIINLAHSLKLKVVAEGVETEEQSHLLRLLDCDEMQGYLFCKPVPVEMFEARYLSPASVVTSR